MITNSPSKKVLALSAIVLAILAVIAGSPYRISILPVTTSEEFLIADKTVRVIDVYELAGWIIDKRDDFVLIDSRMEKEYKKYHIPFSINVPESEINLELSGKINSLIIYDSNERYSIDKLELLINNRSEQIFVLKGGMDEWMNKILFPDLRESSMSKKEIDKIYKTSVFFGGKPILDKERPKRKFRREGC
ncbi:MAG: rhodanese-like domain-containing protein [Ignavibacteria bacterium]